MIAREPGHRTKIAVVSNDPNVDPVGACVGARGSRVRQVVNELRGEKVDIVEWREDASGFISEALSPARVKEVRLDDEEMVATVIVPDHQLSLAIGKEGQNARLAARLTGYKIDIKSESEDLGLLPADDEESAVVAAPEADEAAPAVATESSEEAQTAAGEGELVTEPVEEEPSDVGSTDGDEASGAGDPVEAIAEAADDAATATPSDDDRPAEPEQGEPDGQELAGEVAADPETAEPAVESEAQA